MKVDPATAMTKMLDQAGLAGAYPIWWDEFVGQGRAVKQLRTTILAAQRRNARLPHILLASGVPGIGKTTLALLTAAEFGSNVRIVSGRVTATQARIVLSDMRDKDVLIIDEAHRLVQGGKQHAEWLLHLLTDGVILGPNGPEEQPQISVIATTTDVGRLPDTIRSRFTLTPALTHYSEQEATVIAIKMANRILFEPLPVPAATTYFKIARAANNNPRTIRQLLESIRDIALVDEAAIWDPETEEYDLTEVLEWAGLTPDGLTQTAVQYLTVMLTDFQGEAGERAMVEALQEPGGLASTERLLMEKGLLSRTKSGRVLTKDGIKRAKELRSV